MYFKMKEKNVINDLKKTFLSFPLNQFKELIKKLQSQVSLSWHLSFSFRTSALFQFRWGYLVLSDISSYITNTTALVYFTMQHKKWIDESTACKMCQNDIHTNWSPLPRREQAWCMTTIQASPQTTSPHTLQLYPGRNKSSSFSVTGNYVADNGNSVLHL